MPRIALFALLALAGASTAAAQPADYAREERWAQEIVPSLVVGDAVYLAMPARARVLAILAETEIMPVSASARARIPALPRDACSRQVVIAGADHYFEYRQKELVAAIAAFLSRVLDDRC